VSPTDLGAVRIAVVGAGRMGRVHLDALQMSRGAVASAVVEPVDAAREAARAVGLAAHATLEELLDAGGFDAALIAAPTDLHLALVGPLARAGVPVLCEKPCGRSSAEARVAASVAQEAGSLLQIGYWRRFVPELAALRERIVTGELGEPMLVVCHQWDHEPPSPQFRARSGGIAVDMAVHEIDQVRWLLGQEFAEVLAMPVTSGSEPGPPGDPDCAVVLARLSGGAAATIALGRRFPRADSCWLELIAGEGYERPLFMWGDRADDAFRAALAAQADAFADAVRGAPQRGATGADAVAALSVAERISAGLGG
jgi:myo-inositol 2-dehydrogenase/D-chiro-inositol 1-dehydrogenase